MDTMQKSTNSAMPNPTGRTGLPNWKQMRREKTGIKNLRLKYNKVFGYYLEVTNSFKDLVPSLLYKKADSCQCRALYHSGIKRTGRHDSWCGR